MIRDYVFRVHGDCVRAGYAYPLLATLKLYVPDLAANDRVYFGSLTGVRHLGHGYLGIRQNTQWRCRAPSDMQGRISTLCGRRLLLASHVIQLGQLRVEEVVSSPVLHAEFVAIKSQHFAKSDRHPEHSEFLGWCTDKLREQYGLRKAMVQVGRRRRLHIGEHPAATGYALGLHDLSDEQSLAVQAGGLGGRRHMGGSLFLPGPLPEHVRGERRLYEVAPRDWKRRKAVVPTDVEYHRRAVLFVTAAAEGKHPCAKWLARQEGISRTKAENLIRSWRRDLRMPIEYNPEHKGWETCTST